jgi:hypothetical protein
MSEMSPLTNSVVGGPLPAENAWKSMERFATKFGRPVRPGWHQVIDFALINVVAGRALETNLLH